MKKIIIVLLMLLAFGCSKKYTAPGQLTVEGDQSAPQKTMTTSPMEKEMVEEMSFGHEADVSETALSLEEQAAQVFRDIHFDFDRYDIMPEARPVLDEVASFLNQNKVLSIVITGHCDERGTNEYNLALGEKRSNAARSYLESQGVSSSRITAVTYGEETPVCTEHNEACWYQNRRAHFILSK
ncbi:MAG: peptidoglycan-associated lipoprotein Pal [Nitrospira sp.]|nr:peptidoglycan-associated lipoprotein Pal [bacterium]MBL7048292.1 peptidoglycan-associated lipoprotein Pal [Nitrospira sp.]